MEVNERTTLLLGEIGQLTLRIAVVILGIEIIVTVEMIAEQFGILLNHNILATEIRDVLGTLLAITEIVELLQIEFPYTWLVFVVEPRLANLFLVTSTKISSLRNLYSVLALQFILS